MQVKTRSINDLTKEVFLQRELEKNAPSTGFPDLDKCIKGFLPRHLYLLTAQTNAGKTTLACNFANAVRKQGKKVLYVALEPDIKIVSILASVRTGKSYKDLTDNMLEHDDGLIDVLLQEDVNSLDHLVSIVRNAASSYSLIIIDHISYFIKGDNTNQAQSQAMKTLAQVTKVFRTSVLLIAHLRKEVKEDYISMDDIAGSASFKQDATDVLILLRKKVSELMGAGYTNEAYIYVPKTKVSTSFNHCEIIFQENKAKILSKYNE